MLTALTLAASFALASPAPAELRRTRLSDLSPARQTQQWGDLRFDAGVNGGKLRVAGKVFAYGLGTHADSEIVYDLRGRYRRFRAWVGVDENVGRYRDTPEWKGGKHPSVIFQVIGDGRVLFDSGLMLFETPAKSVDVPLDGIDRLVLVVKDAGDGNYGDWSVWGDATLVGPGPVDLRPVGKRRAYSVSAKDLQVDLSAGGSIVGLRLGSRRTVRSMMGYTDPAGLEGVGKARVAKLPAGGLAFSKKLKRGGSLTERFEPSGDAVRWTVELKIPGKPWSAPIDTVLIWPNPSRCKLWAAWGNAYEWSDPLASKPFDRMNLEYGAFFSRPGGASLPLITVFDGGIGFSMVQSPEDLLVGMQIQASGSGKIALSRRWSRLGEGRTWKFSVYLVAHPADPKSALAWIVRRYPKLFDPPNRLADEVGGGGAYSGDEHNPDTERLRKMGFTFNWKASIDFPYMGMFLPPLANDVRFNRFAGGGGGGYGPGDEGRFGQTSVGQLADYAKRMRAAGFHVLSYFNVTEFGGNIEFPAPAKSGLPAEELWRNPNDFLYEAFPGAILRTPDRPIWTWGGAVIMDCGEPHYRDFLLKQAERHIKDLPAASGICIDRLDWLTQFNPHADDGVSWVDGPARSLGRSWLSLMDRLGPMMHRANKVIFVNAMTRRIDWMGQVDGVYDEHGDYGYNLNTSSWLCLRKPLVCWTRNEDQLKPDPDGFVQRHLYMGAFMTVPMSANDHTILSSPFVDRLYLDYGPLFNALRARKWVLLPHVVTTSVGKANVFSTPKGYVVPIVFGGSSSSANVVLKGLPQGLRPEVLHPGEKDFVPLSATIRHGRLELTVPLVRGCAMVRLREGPDNG